MQKIVLASGNTGKIAEITELLADFPIELVSQSGLGVEDAEETGTTFVENAIIKARHAAELTGLPALADDSGLAIHCLHGRPGVHSSRYAGPGASDQDRINKVLAEIAELNPTDRSATFHCVIVLMRYAKDPAPMILHGEWHGSILDEPRGEHGFGYDPIFYVPTHNCSAAELSTALKNRISHRGHALGQLASDKLMTVKIPS